VNRAPVGGAAPPVNPVNRAPPAVNSVGAPPPLNRAPTATTASDKRTQIAQEVLSTEKSYVESLDRLNQFIVLPLQSFASDPEKAILSGSQIQTLFSTISQIGNLNKKFMEDLAKRVNDWSDTQKIGDLILQFSPFFKMYTTYVNNYDAATKLLVSVDKDKSKFHKFLQEQQANLNGQSLTSFLIMPVQRVPRYILLVQELLKHTQPDHPDYENLQNSLKKLQQIGSTINNDVKKQENLDKIAALQAQFTENPGFVEPGRIFIREGKLKKVCRKSDDKYYFFVFNNLVCYAKKSLTGKYHKFKKFPVGPGFSVETTDIRTHGFTIKTKTKSFVVYSESAAETADWVKTLNELQGNLLEKAQMDEDTIDSAAPVWTTDHSVKQCPLCNRGFTITFRKHHCRKCGDVICGKCSKRKLVIAAVSKKDGEKEKEERVCDRCFDNYMKGLGGGRGERPGVKTLGRQVSMLAIGSGKDLSGSDQGPPVAGAKKHSRQPSGNAPVFGVSTSPKTTPPVVTSAPSPVPPPVATNPWKAYRDQNNNIYYHNSDTQQTVWTLPAGVTCPAPS